MIFYLNQRLLLLLILCVMTSCSTPFATSFRNNQQEIFSIELQSELADLKRQVNSQQVDLQILEEKVTKTDQGSKAQVASSQLAQLEKKITELEKLQYKIVSDMRELSLHANQTTAAMKQYAEKIHSCEVQVADMKEKLGEVVKIKSTLSSISKAMGNNSASNKVYKVRSGDSLEKIAKNQNTSIEEIKKINGLTNDTIMIGQELKIP